MSDKEFWLMIRRGLMMICKAIERKFAGSKEVDLETGESETYSLVIDDEQ